MNANSKDHSNDADRENLAEEAERLLLQYSPEGLYTLKRDHGIEVIEQIARNRGITTNSRLINLIEAIRSYEEGSSHAERLFEKYGTSRLFYIKSIHGIEIIEELARNRGISTDTQPREVIHAIQKYEKAASKTDNLSVEISAQGPQSSQEVGINETEVKTNEAGKHEGADMSSDGTDESYEAHTIAQKRTPPVKIGDVRTLGVEELKEHHTGETVAIGRVESLVIFTYDIPEGLSPLDIIRVKITSFNRGNTSARAMFLEKL